MNSGSCMWPQDWTEWPDAAVAGSNGLIKSTFSGIKTWKILYILIKRTFSGGSLEGCTSDR